MAVLEKIGKNGKIIYYARFQRDCREYYHTFRDAHTREQAEIAEKVLLGEFFQGRYNLVEAKGKQSFESLVELYKEYAKNNKKSWKSEQGKVQRIADYFKGRKLKDITPAMIEEFKRKRKETITKRGDYTSGATVNRDLALLRKMLSLAVQAEWIDRNPALSSKVPVFREENEIIRYLSAEQEKDLINACTGKYQYLRGIILMAIQTGMRWGEIANLQWSVNVDLRGGIITLMATQTKSKKKRVIPLSSLLLDELKKLYKNRINDYVFTNPKTGKPWNDVREGFKAVKRIAFVDEEFRFHDLRHHMATKCMDLNVNVGVIKDLLGHCSLAVTQKYAHAKDSAKRKAVELLATGLI